jgi:AAA+ ATPase superfamily predicted ATPase
MRTEKDASALVGEPAARRAVNLGPDGIQFSGRPVPPFRDWLDAIPYLFRLAGDRVVPVVIDEFPILVKASPALPSIIQRELGPGGSGSASRVRLLLCGSAMSVMGGLLSGPTPLRGRASLELVVHPFGYRDAARFWELPIPSWPYSCIQW